jgi:hypothetical protein
MLLVPSMLRDIATSISWGIVLALSSAMSIESVLVLMGILLLRDPTGG